MCNWNILNVQGNIDWSPINMSSADVGLPEVVVKDRFYVKKVKIYLEHKTSSSLYWPYSNLFST